MKLTFSGNRALILGGTCELGVFLAKEMIKAGLFPILTYRNENGCKNILKQLQSVKGKYDTFYLDFTDRLSLKSLFSGIHDDLDFLVDFAQGDFEDLVASANCDAVYRYFEENISFRAEVLKMAARAMLKKKLKKQLKKKYEKKAGESRARLVFISSAAAIRPNPGQGFYAAAKLASEALYKNLGIEMGSRGITTVTLRPGYIDAGRGKKYLQIKKDGALCAVPIKKAVTCKELTETILFFLSDSAKSFNAVEISMDGRLTSGK